MNKHLSSALIAFITCLAVCAPLWAQAVHDLAAIEAEVRGLVAQIADGTRGDTLQDREFAVTLYQQILGRDPSAEELTTVVAFLVGDRCRHTKEPTCPSCHKVKMARSQLLAWLLAKKENVCALTREHLANNIATLRKLDLTTVPFWQPYVLPKKSAPARADKLSLGASRDEYLLYYGYLHAHTSYSDGEGTPEEAYQMARDVAKLNFFAVTDHGELLHIWPWDNKWDKIKKTAQSFHQDGVFVALHGFEWSSPIFGHINVIESDDFTCAVCSLFIEDICEWITKHPESFSRFNHPGSLDKFGVEFDHFKLYAGVVRQMVGIEMHNGGGSVKEYFAKKAYDGKFNHFDEANQKGWRVGAVGGQDNHTKDWGLKNSYIVGVWAKALTREAIVEAYRERRTFAAEDRNLSVSLRMDGAEMGSRLNPGRKNLVVTAHDQDGEEIKAISIFKSGVPLQTIEVYTKEARVELPITAQAGEYYYAFVTESDGDVALTSPIWIVGE